MHSEDDVIAMVVRNPLLVGISATGYGGADQAGDDTMYMSYVIAATRPAGPFLLYGTVSALAMTPHHPDCSHTPTTRPYIPQVPVALVACAQEARGY